MASMIRCDQEETDLTESANAHLDKVVGMFLLVRERVPKRISQRLFLPAEFGH
jgi:hypothetical protein